MITNIIVGIFTVCDTVAALGIWDHHVGNP